MHLLAAIVSLLKAFTGLLVPMFMKFLLVHKEQLLKDVEEKIVESPNQLDDKMLVGIKLAIDWLEVLYGKKDAADQVVEEKSA